MLERYSSGEPTKHSRFGRVPAKFGMDDVKCAGTEASLLDCRHKTKDNCGAGEGAGVICFHTSRASKYWCLLRRNFYCVRLGSELDRVIQIGCKGYKVFQIIFLIPIHFFSRYPPAIFVLPPNGIKSRDPHIVAHYLHFQ